MGYFSSYFDTSSGLVAILFFGLVLKLIGFAVRDELLLRGLVAAGLLCDVIFYLLRAEPIFASVLANFALVAVNAVLMAAILLERTTWRLSDTDRAIYAHFPTLSPGQFRRLRTLQRPESAAAQAVLIREGTQVRDLMLVFAERIEIGKAGRVFPISGPVFVGEVAFLTGDASSATVALPDGGRVVRFNADALRAMMARSPALNNAIVALFGAELARKVAYSVPLPSAAPPALPASARCPAKGAG